MVMKVSPSMPTIPQGIGTVQQFGRRGLQRLGPCCFAAGLPEFAHYLQQEVTVEGVLHVSAVQAGACMERFGDLEAGLPAPTLPSLDSVLANPEAASAGKVTSSTDILDHVASSRERVVSEAFCLATPPDSPEEPNNSPMRQLAPSTARAATTGNNTNSFSAAASSAPDVRGRQLAGISNSSSSPGTGANRGVCQMEEELAQVEVAAAHRAYLAECMYLSEVLQASAAIRRRRRRRLLRLLRTGRDTTSSTLQALKAGPAGLLLATLGSMSSLASWDDAAEQLLSDSDSSSSDDE